MSVYSSVVSLLIDFPGTSVHSRDGKGNTAIIISAGRGMVEVMQVLLKYGANPEDMSNGGLFDGKTALCWAASQGMNAMNIFYSLSYLFVIFTNRERKSGGITIASRCKST